MGGEGSKIDPAKMPYYFVEDPFITAVYCGLLERSLRNIIGHVSSHKNKRLPFLKFYETFWDKYLELEAGDEIQLAEYLEKDMETRSLFLVRLLKLIVLVPQQLRKKVNQNKLDGKSRKQFKKFSKDYYKIKLECYGKLGEALFHSMEKCDEMYAEYITQAWITGYSLFLKHFIPIAVKVRAKIARKSGDSHLGVIDEGYDLSSDTNSSDGSLDSGFYFDGFEDEEIPGKQKRSASRGLMMQLHKKRMNRKKNADTPFDRSHFSSVQIRKQLREIWQMTEKEIKANDVVGTPKNRRHSWDETKQNSAIAKDAFTRMKFSDFEVGATSAEHINKPLAIRVKRRQKSWTLNRASYNARAAERGHRALSTVFERRHSSPGIMWSAERWNKSK